MHATLTLPVPAVAPAFDPFAPIAADLEETERLLARSLKSKLPGVAAVADHVRHYRGKRLRPILLLLSARACGKVSHAHHVLAAVVEMIHTATLVHDDILDSALVRRRVATVNSKWGTQPALLLGDYLFSHAFHLAATVGDARACEIIGRSTNRVCEGELCQVLNRGNLDLTEDDYFDIIDGKTAELTACCAKLGAMYAGAKDEVIDAMERYGRWLGQAFQIADDLLDLTGQETLAGKSLGTDLEQGKLTLPLLHALRGPHAERVRLLLTSDNANRRESLRPWLGDSLAYARRVALDLAAKARRELALLPPSACRSILEATAEKAVHREA
ncbi:MAG: polyprenyl synthetase family protein [Gemmataceae bacterium]|nr:polyprenyl synthetase family protein [Gemmataceae bacterium]